MSPGLRHMLAATLWFSVMSALVKFAGARLPSSEIVLIRVVVTLLLSALALRGTGLSPWGNHQSGLVLRGLFGFGGLYCYYYAVTHLPLANASVIHFTNPLLTSVLAAIVLGETADRRALLAMFVSFSGVVIVARPTGAALDTWGLAAAVASAVFSAGAYLSIRALRDKDDPRVVVFYFPLVSLPLAVVFAWGDLVWPTAREWPVLVGVGVATQIAQVHVTKGLLTETASRATAMSYLQIVFAAIIGAAAFSEIPSWTTFAGGACILTGTWVVTFASKSETREGKPR